jgi:hypothetical protein
MSYIRHEVNIEGFCPSAERSLERKQPVRSASEAHRIHVGGARMTEAPPTPFLNHARQTKRGGTAFVKLLELTLIYTCIN